jgi:hypothetical protein
MSTTSDAQQRADALTRLVQNRDHFTRVRLRHAATSMQHMPASLPSQSHPGLALAWGTASYAGMAPFAMVAAFSSVEPLGTSGEAACIADVQQLARWKRKAHAPLQAALRKRFKQAHSDYLCGHLWLVSWNASFISVVPVDPLESQHSACHACDARCKSLHVHLCHACRNASQEAEQEAQELRQRKLAAAQALTEQRCRPLMRLQALVTSNDVDCARQQVGCSGAVCTAKMSRSAPCTMSEAAP